MKKILSIIIAGTVFFSLCSGCQTEKKAYESVPMEENAEAIEAQPNENSLTVCVDASYESIVKNILNCWEYLNEGVHAELIVIPDDESAAEIKISEIQAEIMSGGGPDVFLVLCKNPNAENQGPVMFQNPEQIMYTNVFLPLDEYLQRAQYLDMSALNQTVMEAGQTEEGQMILPMYYDYYAYAFRADELENVQQLPSSWKELISCEEEMIAGAVGSCLYAQFYEIFGDLVNYETGTPDISEDELLELVQQAVNYSNKANETQFTPDVVFTGSSSILPQTLASDRKEKHAVFALPNVEDGITANITMFAAINRNTRQPENAFSLLDVLFSDEIMSGRGFEDGDTRIGSRIQFPEGITVNNEVFKASIKGCSEEDEEAILDMNERINAVRFNSEIDEELLNMYRDCLFADSESEQMDYVSKAFNSIWMKLSE